MGRLKENRQSDGGMRRNLIRVGPDLLTVPQIARQYSGAALHVMACIALGRDPDSVEIGSTVEEIMAGGIKVDDMPWKDRMRASETVLNRAVGKPLDFQSMRELERIQESNLLEMSMEELLQMAGEVEDADFSEKNDVE
jgi:hypothetical protein